MDKKFENFKKTVNIVVERKNKDRLYNISAVSKMLGLSTKGSYSQQCDTILEYLRTKSSTNKAIKTLLDNAGDDRDTMCNILVNSLYELFSPNSVPKKAPIQISQEEYMSLIKKKKEEDITYEENETLDEALNCKYCHCVKKLYLKNQFQLFIKEEEPKYNPYAICMSSIYKNRDIKPPFKVSHSCREKYDWYK